MFFVQTFGELNKSWVANLLNLSIPNVVFQLEKLGGCAFCDHVISSKKYASRTFFRRVCCVRDPSLGRNGASNNGGYYRQFLNQSLNICAYLLSLLVCDQSTQLFDLFSQFATLLLAHGHSPS